MCAIAVLLNVACEDGGRIKNSSYVESKELKFDSKSVITFIFVFIVDLFMYSTILLKHVLYEIQQTTTAEICVSSTYLMSRVSRRRGHSCWIFCLG